MRWVRTLGLDDVGGFGIGSLVFLVLLLLFPAGAFVALRPMSRKAGGGVRRWHALNAAIAALLLAGFATLTVAVGEEIYRCDVLRIPNCD